MSNKFNAIITHEGKETGALREYVDKSLLGAQIKKDLLTKISVGQESSVEGFYIGYRDEYVGLLSQCYGAVSILLLQNGFETELSKDEEELILRTISFILDYIDEHGYDMDPYIENKFTDHIFRNGTYRYTDTLSWVLSVIIHARFANKNQKLNINEDLTHRLAATAKDILKFYIDTVIGGVDDPQGWGYVNGCEEPSIYYTYAAIEAFNDFEDYIMGNEEIGTIEDREFLDIINRDVEDTKELQEKFKDIKVKIGISFWNRYKDSLHTEFIADNGAIISKEQIRNSTRTSALFFTVYIVCILIYCETDKSLPKQADRTRLAIIANQALQMVSSFYDVLSNEGLDSIVNKHILSFEQSHPEKKKLIKIFGSTSIVATTLTPMLIKANGLLTFYVTQFPEREMSRYFDMAIERRINNGQQWLWEESKYELPITERYIEALLDFYDYYEAYEKEYLMTKIELINEEQEMEKRITERLRPVLQRQIQEEQKETHETELKDLREELRASYQIEELINQKINEAIETRTLDVLRNVFLSIAQFNKDQQTTDDDENASILAADFISAIKSYLYKYTYEARKFNDELYSKDELVDVFSDDFEQFLQAWFIYLVTYKGRHGMQYFFKNIEDDDSRYLRKNE